MTTACIALGSNLQDPAAQLHRAVLALHHLPGCRVSACSRVYRNPALGPGIQPDYLNAAVLLETCLPPLDLLDATQAIENSQGRQREIRWGARTLDLDILLYGDEQIDLPRLQVPHPRLAERAFALVPLADLLGEAASLPGLGPLGSLRAACADTTLEPVEWQLPTPFEEEYCHER